MLVAPLAPHSPWQPARRYENAYANEPFQPANKPSFNEADVSDKPLYARDLPLLTEEEVIRWMRWWRRSLATGRSLDDLIRGVWEELSARGQLANTYIIFAPDNGYLWGEHRQKGKGNPYQESIRTIMYVWGPGVVPGEDTNLVSNIDLLPTFMDIAGQPIPEWADGRSLMPLFRGERPPWRSMFLVQNKRMTDDEGNSEEGSGTLWAALTTSEWTYTKYNTEAEYYDLVADPFELNNAAASLDPAFVAAVDERLKALRVCVGAECRSLEEAPL